MPKVNLTRDGQSTLAKMQARKNAARKRKNKAKKGKP